MKQHPWFKLAILLGLAISVFSQEFSSVCVLENNLVFSSIIGKSVIRNARLQIDEDGIILQSLTLSGNGASAFQLQNSPQATPVERNSTLNIPIQFSPTSPGPKLARLDIVLQSSASSKTFSVGLRGLAGKAYGGTDEPSLQWVLDAFNFPINVEDDDPSNALFRNDAGEQGGYDYGDEIRGQLFQVADETSPVTIQLLSTFGPTTANPVVKFGYYLKGSSSSPSEMFVVPNTPESNGQTLLPTLNGQTTFQPPAGAIFGFFSQWPFFGNRYIFTEDALNTFDPNYLHHVRVYAVPGEQNAYILAFEEYTAVKDFQDIVVVVRNVKIPKMIQYRNLAAPLLSGNTPQPGFYHNWLVFSRIDQATPDHKFHDVNTIRFQNLDNTTAVTIKSLSIGNTSLFNFPNADNTRLPISIAPGASFDLNVKFVATGGQKGVLKSRLVVETSDPNNSPLFFTLSGAYQLLPEGDHELHMVDFLDAFGWKINGSLTLTEKADSPLRGEEVRSPLWTRADPTQPMFVIQTAAYHQCCQDTGFIDIAGYPRLMHATPWGQSILPMYMQDPTKLTTMTIEPTGNFPLVLGGLYSTANTTTLGVIMYPLRDSKGKLWPNAWYAAQDYVLSGCGSANGNGNCDFNDNQYIITNLKPASGAQMFGNLNAPALQLDFDNGAANTLLDKDNEPTGFTHVMPNDQDVSVGSNSYVQSAIDVSYATGRLAITSSPGTLWAGLTGNTLKNALLLNINGTKAYSLMATIVGPLTNLNTGTRQIGVLIGTDKNNNVKLAINANNGNPVIEFFSKVQGVGKTIANAAVQNLAAINSLTLKIDSDPTGQMMTASYNINNGTWAVLPTSVLLNNNTNWFFGFPVSGGIYAAGEGFVATFDSFRVVTADSGIVRKCSEAYVEPDPIIEIPTSPSPSPSVEPTSSPVSSPTASAVPTTSVEPSPSSSVVPTASALPSDLPSPSVVPSVIPTGRTSDVPDEIVSSSSWLGISVTFGFIIIGYFMAF